MAALRAPGGELMADQSDVEQVLATIVSGVLYPQGTDADSLVGAPCGVFRGWPDAAGLDAALLGGQVTVTVAADPRTQRTTTRYPDIWRARAPAPATLLASVDAQTVTFSGTAALGQVAGILVDGVAAVHRTVPGDTPAAVATTLAGLLAGMPGALAMTTVQGATVALPPGAQPVARVEPDQPSIRETRRQLQAFRVVCWCGDPATRDQVSAAIDTALSAWDFLGLPDGMAGRLRFIGTTSTDRAEAAALYRRDLIYTVDYATTISASLPRLLAEGTRVFGDGALIKILLS
jgi:hypothetical protein